MPTGQRTDAQYSRPVIEGDEPRRHRRRDGCQEYYCLPERRRIRRTRQGDAGRGQVGSEDLQCDQSAESRQNSVCEISDSHALKPPPIYTDAPRMLSRRCTFSTRVQALSSFFPFHHNHIRPEAHENLTLACHPESRRANVCRSLMQVRPCKFEEPYFADKPSRPGCRAGGAAKNQSVTRRSEVRDRVGAQSCTNDEIPTIGRPARRNWLRFAAACTNQKQNPEKPRIDPVAPQSAATGKPCFHAQICTSPSVHVAHALRLTCTEISNL